MGKKYLDTKENSLESSILGVWKQAAEENEEINDAVSSVRMDGRTRTYREHRAKLEAARVRREAKKNQIETNKNDKSDDGEGLDAVQKDAVKKNFKDRKDKDIDNDGDTDDSDKYLHNRRKTVTKAVAKEEVEIDESPFSGKGAWDKMKFPTKGVKTIHPKKSKKGKKTDEETEAEKLHKDSYEMGTDEYREYLEKLTPGEGIDKEWEQARDFKVQSMRETLAQVWGLDEWKSINANRRVSGGDGRRTEKEAHKPGHEEEDDEEKNGKKGKKGKADTGTGKPAAIEIDPTIKASKGY